MHRRPSLLPVLPLASCGDDGGADAGSAGYAPVVGLNMPTPLSMPCSLEAVRAALEKAAA